MKFILKKFEKSKMTKGNSPPANYKFVDSFKRTKTVKGIQELDSVKIVRKNIFKFKKSPRIFQFSIFLFIANSIIIEDNVRVHLLFKTKLCRDVLKMV